MLTNIVAATQVYTDFHDDRGTEAALAIINGFAGQSALAAGRYGTHSLVLARDLPQPARSDVETAYERVSFMCQTLVYAEAEHDLGAETIATLHQTHDDCEHALHSLTAHLQQIGEQL
jgi:hypothetical protein